MSSVASERLTDEQIRAMAEALSNNAGLRRVNHWTLENDDVSADDVAIAANFARDVDDLMEITDFVIERIGR
jgi:hypothetical protein